MKHTHDYKVVDVFTARPLAGVELRHARADFHEHLLAAASVE